MTERGVTGGSLPPEAGTDGTPPPPTEADGAAAPQTQQGAGRPIEDVDARMAKLFARVRGDEQPDGGTAPASNLGGVAEDRSWSRPPPPLQPVPGVAAPPYRGTVPPDAWAPPPPAPPQRRRRRVWPFVAAGALVVAGAGAAVAALGRRGGTDTSSALTSAVATTEHAKTADIALSLTIGSAGSTLTIAGNGATDLVANATNLTLTFAVGGHRIAERAVIDGATSYYNLGALVGMLVPGKSWVSEKTGQSAGGSTGIGSGGIFVDPSALVAVLGAHGTQVHGIGPAQVDGVAVQQYAIHLGRAGIEKVTSSQRVPPFMRAQVAATHFRRIDYRVAVDGADHLTQVRAVGTYSVRGLDFTVTSRMDLSRYGTPVVVTPPAADTVVPMQQFDQIAQQNQGTASL